MLLTSRMEAQSEDRNKVETYRYAVISPVRDEARFIEMTITSMIQQTIKPISWTIVNDGSSDGTEAIVERWTKEYPWIHLVNRDDRGTRQRGKGVIEAFYAGYRTVDQDFDFIVKLDGDVSFEPDYFESLLKKFAADPQLGITGGGVYERRDGKNWTLRAVKDHVRGPTKVYRRACFDAINGLVPALGWDGIDEWSALSIGWKVQGFLEFKLLHYRYTGAATGTLKSVVEQGVGAYRMGYHPLFIIARSIRHAARRPYVIRGIAMLAGFIGAWLRQEEMLADPGVVRFVRKTQVRKLFGLILGKPVHD
jgi:poly-beta-1,6-N-acetyl-D-glucosamine synthase